MTITKITQQEYNQNIGTEQGFKNSILSKTHGGNRVYYKISEEVDLGYIEITNSRLTIKQLYVLVEHRNKSLRIIKEIIKFMFSNNPNFYIICTPKIQAFLSYCDVNVRLIRELDSTENLLNLEITGAN